MNATSCYWSYTDLYTWHLQHSRRSRIQKQPQEMFLKILQISQESTCVEVSFYIVASLQVCNVTKKDSYAGAFLWNLRNSEEHLFWRTSERLLLCIDYFIIYLFLQSSTVHVLQFYRELLWRSISLNEIFSFWKLKISFTKMFHESVKKQFNWNLI